MGPTIPVVLIGFSTLAHKVLKSTSEVLKFKVNLIDQDSASDSIRADLKLESDGYLSISWTLHNETASAPRRIRIQRQEGTNLDSMPRHLLASDRFAPQLTNPGRLDDVDGELTQPVLFGDPRFLIPSFLSVLSRKK